jgi:GTP-binding protein
MNYMPLAFITAQTGRNVKALLNLSQTLFKQANRRVTTGTLNRVLREAVAAHAPPSRENRNPRIYYATQVGVAPPTIVLFVNSTKLFDATYQRYLLNVFREKLPFKDVPIKLYMRARTQSEPGSSSSSQREEASIEDYVEIGEHGSRPLGEFGRRSSVVDPESVGLNLEVNELLAELDD